MTRLAVLAVSALIIGCTTGHLSEQRDRSLTRVDESVSKGVGMVLYTPRLITVGPQRIVVALAVGSPVKMANVTAVWLTYRSPRSTVQHTVRMLPVGDYNDAFGAVMPFTEAGLYHVSIHVYRVGGVPATSTFSLLCCGNNSPTTFTTTAGTLLLTGEIAKRPGRRFGNLTQPDGIATQVGC